MTLLPGQTITRDGVLAALEAAVAEKGADYIYIGPYGQPDGHSQTSCFYVHDDGKGGKRCGCLVGDALHRVGVPLEWMEPYDLDGVNTSANDLLNFLAIDHSLVIEAGVIMILGAAQGVQDTGGTWGRALERAKAVA